MQQLSSTVLVGLYITVIVILASSCISKKADSEGISSTADTFPKLHIEYLAHASFILTFENTSLLLDPFADTTWINYMFPRNIKADAIFSTHPHYDHDGGIFRDLKPYWQGNIPFYQDPGKYQIAGFKIEGLKGKHCDPYGKEFDQKNTIFIYDVAGLRLAHWGDNGGITDELAKGLTDIDILFLPIDDYYHILKADEIDQIISRVDPKIIIPMHYKISELEPYPDMPKDLGTIDKFLSKKENVVYLENNKITLDPEGLPPSLEYMVFKHSPKVRNP